MWDNFNESHNIFTLALQESLGSIKVVKGYSLKSLPKCRQPFFTIFGPFGNNWKNIRGRKLFYTGENQGPIHHPDVFNVGFRHDQDSKYLRIPFWMLSLDIFAADLNRIQNPIPLPVHTCTHTPFFNLNRPKFCAFIVSNSKNKIRNSAFHALNRYKTVDSAGKLFNTVGNLLFAGKGGGGGERKKHEFLKQYRFCLAYENEIGDGYVTEKLLHAKAAGCIPIYWGSSSANLDFNPLGFINCSSCSEEEMVSKVKELEEHPEKWMAMASVPLFNTDSLQQIRTQFKKLTDYIYP
jgi:hypothetical protein